MSDEQMIKIKVVDLERLYNFIVEHFLTWINFASEKYVRILKNLKFEFFKRPRMERRPKWKL
jgi:hypothetical protein